MAIKKKQPKKPTPKPRKGKGVNWGNVEEANERNAAGIAASIDRDRARKKK